MPKTQEMLTINKRTATKWFVGVLVLIIFGFGWMWWRANYQNTTRVFWDMIDNNLSLASVTKHNYQSQQGSSTDQYTQVQFGKLSASHGLSTVKQQGNSVSSETIGTKYNDYSRYLSIQTAQKTSAGKSVDTSKFTGIWGKTTDAPKGQVASVQYYQQSVLGVVPHGSFTREQRRSLIEVIQNNKTYELGNVKSEKQGKRAVYVYDVKISPQGLITMLAQYAKELGLGDIGLNPKQYVGSPAVKTKFTVDKLSHQLLKVKYESNNQEETYSSVGLEQTVLLPVKTIPIAELQNKVVQSLK